MIPIAKPFLGREEASAAKETVLSRWVTQGPKVKQFENAFASYVGSKYACAVSNCTSALHIALLTVGVKPGDVVITVSHSFIATANSVRHCGAEPVFVDIDPDTYNISPGCFERCLNENCEIQDSQLFYRDIKRLAVAESPLGYFIKNNKRLAGNRSRIGRIAAIMPVHQMGMPCDMSAILQIASKFNLPVIEDAACAIGSEIAFNNCSRWEKIGKPCGDIACFSFHPRKVITTGDGGMLTTNNPVYDKKFRLLRHHGMSISDLARHKSKKAIFEQYVISGYNYRMTDIQAAVGIEQLKKLPKMLAERRKIADLYRQRLKDISWLKLPNEPVYCKTNWQSYPIRVLENAPLSRDELIQYLLDNNVASKPGIMNAHLEKPYLNAGYSLKNSEKARKQVFLLPIYVGLEEKEIEKICKLVSNL